MTTGLVLGKFAPLHRGHQLLFDIAMKENDRVVAIIYDSPEVTNIPLQVRSGWIKQLYPTVEVIEAWDGPSEVGDTPGIKSQHEAYLKKLLAYHTIDAFYSSEFYGEHVSEALGAIDRRIDPDRIRIPISGTALRKNAFVWREFVDPIVYRNLVTKVVFLGAPSTGKSTLAQEIALLRGTVWMPEYGREYWEKHQVDRRLTLDQLVEIAETHIDQEDQIILQAKGEIFIDTNAITTYLFSLYYHGVAHPRLAELARQAPQRYDLTLLCEDDIPYDDTWDRSGAVQRTVFQKRIRADLLERKIPFFTLRGSIHDRTSALLRILDRFTPYTNLGDLVNET
jgi:HTH-type transcriptional regulator, transcriptional repressor of NAD biosynthesis genes